VPEIAAELRVSGRSVQRWRRAWEAGGAPGLASKGQAGRCSLDDDQLAELDRVLDADPAAAGCEDQRWTLARIWDLIAAKFKVQYTVPGTWCLLRRRGWSCQTGARRAAERNDGAIEVWKKETWPRVKDRDGPWRLDRLEDETSQSLRPRGPGPGAARHHPGHPGVRRQLRVGLGCRAGLLPARLPHPADLPVYRLHHYRGRKGERKSFTWQEYRDLLTAAHHQLPGGNIVLIWDNLNVHLRAELRAFIAAQAWLEVSQLPSYAPDLNPVEGIWSVLKRGPLANVSFAGFAHLLHVRSRRSFRLPELVNVGADLL
jgi:transposase